MQITFGISRRKSYWGLQLAGTLCWWKCVYRLLSNTQQFPVRLKCCRMGTRDDELDIQWSHLVNNWPPVHSTQIIVIGSRACLGLPFPWAIVTLPAYIIIQSWFNRIKWTTEYSFYRFERAFVFISNCIGEVNRTINEHRAGSFIFLTHLRRSVIERSTEILF